jgi:hypothetical protein
MPKCGHVPAGIHHALVFAILMGIIGLGSLSAALVVAVHIPWPGARFTLSAQRHVAQHAAEQRSPVVAGEKRPPPCAPERLTCAAHSLPPAMAASPSSAASGVHRPRSGERELFLKVSASLARRRVWLAQSGLPPQMEVAMTASTLPIP